MKEKIAYALWACLYILCVGLGFVSDPQGVGKVLLVLTALIFFLPGAWLLWEGLRQKNRKMLLRLRLVALSSLALTVIFIVANFLSVNASETTGKVLYEILALVSAPMLCGQYWFMSLFLWACLLMGSLHKKKDKS